MPRPSGSRIPGVSITDLWEARNVPPERRPFVKRWWVRVRDPNTQKSVSKTFPEGRVTEARDWGTRQRAKFISGIETAG